MATAASLLADLNDAINDASNTQVPEADKIRYLNRGLGAMWPKVYRTVVDESLAIVADQYEYDVPAAVGDYGLVTRVDIETQDGSGRFYVLEEWELTPVQTSKKLILSRLPSEAGSTIRITSAKRLTEFTASSSTYDGPPGTEEIPVWYALGRVMGRRQEDRLDFTRYATVAAQNGVDINEVMNSAQFCYAQFELLLDRAEMPLPTQGG